LRSVSVDPAPPPYNRVQATITRTRGAYPAQARNAAGTIPHRFRISHASRSTTQSSRRARSWRRCMLMRCLGGVPVVNWRRSLRVFIMRQLAPLSTFSPPPPPQKKKKQNKQKKTKTTNSAGSERSCLLCRRVFVLWGRRSISLASNCRYLGACGVPDRRCSRGDPARRLSLDGPSSCHQLSHVRRLRRFGGTLDQLRTDHRILCSAPADDAAARARLAGRRR